jgi:hypothetical protein
MSKTQNVLAQQVGRQQSASAGQKASLSSPVDTSANSTFLAGVPVFRQRLDPHPKSDPVFVLSYLLKHRGIYAGMDSIVLAGNAAQKRIDARAVIVHLQSNVHKRASIVVLSRELVRQRLVAGRRGEGFWGQRAGPVPVPSLPGPSVLPLRPTW